MYSNKKTKRNKNHKRRSKQQKSKKGGSTNKHKKRIVGGNVFFGPTYNVNDVNAYNAYPLNTYSNIPPLESARNLPAITGGKRKSMKAYNKYRNKSNKIKGGLAALSPESLNDAPNSLNSGLNSSGSSILNSAPIDIPLNVPYGGHNPALI
jgi:hypothetical protein